MKINDIPLGGRFVLEGQTYVKTGPMMARGEGGETRVVPRYMVLQAADGAVAGPQAAYCACVCASDRQAFRLDACAAVTRPSLASCVAYPRTAAR